MEYMELMMQQRYEAVEAMFDEFYSELDATICSCMAAGVPASHLILTQPKLDSSFDFSSYEISCYIGFRPEELR